MAEKITMSLDDIIKSNKRTFSDGAARGTGTFRYNGGSRRGNTNFQRFRGGINMQRNHTRYSRDSNPYTRTYVNSAREHVPHGGNSMGEVSATGSSLSGPAKLFVSNLDSGVTDFDLQQLFSAIGTLTNSRLRYDQSCKSLGMADVTFERKADAIEAIKKYNGVPLDGRPMHIQLNTTRISSFAHENRWVGSSTHRGRGRATSFQNRSRFHYRAPGYTPGQERYRWNNGHSSSSNTSRPRGGRGGNTRMATTAEQLNAELDAYAKERV